jgi:hypothetical protein
VGSLVCLEGPNLFLNNMYLLKEFGYKKTALYVLGKAQRPLRLPIHCHHP